MTSPDVAVAGAVALDVEPDARGFYPRLRAQIIPEAERLGREVGARIGAPMAAHVAESVSDGVTRGARPAQASAARVGENIGAAMGRGLKARVTAALKTIPDVDIDADSSKIDRKVANIRRQLVELSQQRIGVDLDEQEALDRLQLLRNQLSQLARDVEKVREAGGEIPLEVDAIQAGAQITNLKKEIQQLQREAAQQIKIEAKAEAAAAKAELAAVAAQARAVDGQDVDIDVDVHTAGAMANLAAMGAASLASAGGLQVLLSVAALLGPIIVPAAAAAAAALAAIGPAALVGAAGVGVLALAASGVIGAVTALNAAQQETGRSAGQAAAGQTRLAAAADQVAAAERALANTRANAADSQRRAINQTRQAITSLAAAEREARQARDDLTRAQREATETQEDLNLALVDGELAQRAALLDLDEARAELDAVMSNPRSTEAEKQRAQLAFDQAEHQLEVLRVRQERLRREKEEADKAGVDGSRQVLAAQERIAEADQRVIEARERLAEARLGEAAAARQAAFAIAQAQQAVTNAHRAAEQAAVSAGGATSAAAEKARAALAKLSPAGREFALFLLSVKDAFTGVRRAAETGLFPGVQAGITAFLPMLPQVELFVLRVATAMGDLFRRAGQALTAPFWQDFFAQLGGFAGPALATFGDIIGDLARGFASLFVAFMPLSAEMGGGFAGMAAGFAEWAAGLSESEKFAAFVDYVRENGPALLSLLGDIIELAVKLGVVFAPLGEILAAGLGVLFAWLSELDPKHLALIAVGLGAIAATLTLMAGGPIALIVAGIVAVVAGLIYAYQHFEGFRRVVDTVVGAVADAAVWLWETVLKPVFGFIAAGAVIVGEAAMWLWENAIQPAFTAIGAFVTFWWENVTKPIFGAFMFIIENFIVPIVLFLWHNVFEPAFKGIQLAISIAWAAIQVIFGLWQIAFKIISAIVVAFYHTTIKPIFDAVGAAIGFVWRTIIKPILETFGNFITDHVAPAFKRGVDAVSAAWEKVRDVAKTPIKFVLETVLNNGLLAAYNKIASMFGVKPDNVQIPIPAGFAGGGYVDGMGGPTSDSIAARLSRGEYVIPSAAVQRFGVGFFDWLIGKSVPSSRSAVTPGDGSEGLAFAEGGWVGFLEDSWNTLTDPIGYVRDQVAALVAGIPGARALADVLKGASTTLLDGVVAWIRSKITNVFTGEYAGPVSAEVADVQQWVTRQAGRPYIWAAVGPDGYDCSGLVGAVYNVMHGQPPHSRTFTTHNQAAFFPKPGFGVLTAGWAGAGERGGGQVGHTAGNLAGLGFESRGGVGVLVGKGAADVGSFAHVGTYDSGGWLQPGWTWAYNGTGQPERITTGPDWAAMTRDRQASGSTVTYNVYPRQAVIDERNLRTITTQQETLARVGRPG